MNDNVKNAVDILIRRIEEMDYASKTDLSDLFYALNELVNVVVNQDKE